MGYRPAMSTFRKLLFSALVVSLAFASALPARASDATAPTVSGATIASDGVTITFTFDEPMAAQDPGPSFTLSVNGNYVSNASLTIGSIAAGATSFQITMSAAVDSTSTLEYSYLGTVGVRPEDLAGNQLTLIFSEVAISTAHLPAPPTFTTGPALSLSLYTPSGTSANWTASVDDQWMMACIGPIVASSSQKTAGEFSSALSGSCVDISDSNAGRTLPTNLAASQGYVYLSGSWATYDLTQQRSRPYVLFAERSGSRYGWSSTVALPNQINSQPDLRELSPIEYDAGDWRLSFDGVFMACPVAFSAQTTPTSNPFSSCKQLVRTQNGFSDPVDIATAWTMGGGPSVEYTTVAAQFPHVVYYEQNPYTNEVIWAASIQFSGGSSSGSGGSGEEEVPPPVYYGGPKITGFSKPASLGSALGGDIRLEGKRMAKVTSATIGGVAADFVSTRTSLQVTVPTGLQPGVYDLVLQTTSGRHTIIRFITISTIN